MIVVALYQYNERSRPFLLEGLQYGTTLINIMCINMRIQKV